MSDRIARARQIGSSASLAGSDARGDSGSSSRVAVTTAIAAYPTAAAVYYGVQLADVSGPETEGQPATFDAGGVTFYALNLGTNIPDVGTHILIDLVPDGRWVFNY